MVLLITLLPLLLPVKASLFDHSKALGSACGLASHDLHPECTYEDYDCLCGNKKFIQSVQRCISKYSKNNSTEAGAAFDKFAFDFCEAHNVEPAINDAWKDSNDDDITEVNDTKFMKAYAGEKNNMEMKETSLWLGIGMIFYWVLVTASVTAFRCLRAWCYRFLGHGVSMGRPNKLSLLMKKYVIWPAFIGHRHMSRFEYFHGWAVFSTPLRFEVLVCCGYIILALIFMLTPYTYLDEDPLFPTKWKEMMRYSSDRAGIIATVQFPLITLFATRNNLLIWITGWSYTAFNCYHRATARITYLLLIIHAVIKHIFSQSYGGSLVKYYYPVPYFRWGVAALGLLSLMIASAIIRARGYEIFYRFHQAFAFCAMLCSIYHLKGIGFQTPLYIAYGFWGADLIIRVSKIIFMNVNLFLPPLPGAQQTTYATAAVYENDLILIRVTTPLRWVCSPGQYIYLHTRRWLLIGGHPFSVIGSSENDEGLELLVQPRLGFTNRLMKNLKRRGGSPEDPVTIPVFIEGPYGITAPVHRYDTGLFFAGGVGITGVIGYIDKMIKSQKRKIPKRVKLYWAIKREEDVEPVRDRLEKFLSREGFELYIYIHHKPSDAVKLQAALQSSSDETLNEAKIATGIKHNTTTTTNSAPSDPDEPSHANKVRFTAQSADWNLEDLPEKTQQKRKSKRISVRDSITKTIKARHPDDDDEYDYGRGSYEHYKAATNASTDSSLNSQVDFTAHITPNTHYARNDLPEFIAAGFRDVLYDRKVLPSSTFNKRNTIRFPNKVVELHSKPTIEQHIIYEGLTIPQVIEDQFWTLGSSICVVGCGPDRMMDTLRWSCCEFLLKSRCDRIDYYEEAFRW